MKSEYIYMKRRYREQQISPENKFHKLCYN